VGAMDPACKINIKSKINCGLSGSKKQSQTVTAHNTFDIEYEPLRPLPATTKDFNSFDLQAFFYL
jgi:hypothetical protein